ncbi:AraC family transcriptional regulator [Paenibacillus sp. P26]|nr:AraC family transcriptional regulator [Paenibacillus sp. P26]UUZ94092.1 AraC family transcriptional regulator [Paenibacillus sp. P25]
MHECKGGRLGFEAFVRASLTQLLVRIRRLALDQPDSQHPFTHPMQEKISEIVVYLNQHYAEEIKLRPIAQQFHISPYYLCRIFKKLTGFHFSEYVQAVRVKEAQRMLRDSRDKVVHIAQSVGFEHVSHFNATFKKVLGVTPLRYRKNLPR